MPNLRVEKFYGDDRRWLGSTSGLSSARTVKVKLAGFAKPNGYIQSGTPVAVVGGEAVPYVADENVTTGAGVLAGHLATDVTIPFGSTDTHTAAPVMDSGRVKPSLVPGGFVVPAAEAKRANVTIVYAD